MTRKQPPKTAAAMRRFDYIVTYQEKRDPELGLLAYTVHARSEHDAYTALSDLLRDQSGIVAMILCPDFGGEP